MYDNAGMIDNNIMYRLVIATNISDYYRWLGTLKLIFRGCLKKMSYFEIPRIRNWSGIQA